MIKNWSVGIFHFTFGQRVYWSERAKEADLKESDWGNHMVSVQSSINVTECISLFENDYQFLYQGPVIIYGMGLAGGYAEGGGGTEKSENIGGQFDFITVSRGGGGGGLIILEKP